MTDFTIWMAGRIKRLSAGDPTARATLAALRSPRASLSDPRIAALFDGLPLSDWDSAHPAVQSDAEAAGLAALSLYALSARHHAGQGGVPWARAAGRLSASGEHGVARGYMRVMSAPSWAGLIRALRSLTGLMAARGMGCDFVRLAADLKAWRNPRLRGSVRMCWARAWAYAPRMESEGKTYDAVSGVAV
jgi:CRISPR type I-E-associated protein CasB/Cse2